MPICNEGGGLQSVATQMELENQGTQHCREVLQGSLGFYLIYNDSSCKGRPGKLE